MNLRIWDHWGSIRVIDLRYERVRIPRSGGYDTIAAVMLDLECECGKTWTIAEDDFPGRRKMRDCGCGLSVTANIIVTFYLRKAKIHEKLKAESAAAGMTMSHYINNLIEGLYPDEAKGHVGSTRTS